MIINTGKEVDVVKSYKRRKFIVKILLYIAGFFAVLSITSLRYNDPTLTELPHSTEVAIGMGICIVALLIAFFVWRCPVCRKFFGISIKVRACHRCNTIFQSEDKK